MKRSEARFSRAQVWVHATFAGLVLLAIASAAFLWIDPLAQVFGRRAFITQVHTVVGLLLPVPLALGVISPAFRRDAARLNRMSSQDWEWIRAKDRRSGRIPVSRFNAGQKLNAAFTVGAVLVLFGTGLVMGSVLASWPTDYRTGATWVHDWTAFGLTIAVVGHIYFALKYRTGDASAPASEPDKSRVSN